MVILLEYVNLDVLTGLEKGIRWQEGMLRLMAKIMIFVGDVSCRA